jgi:hypothetical protein
MSWPRRRSDCPVAAASLLKDRFEHTRACSLQPTGPGPSARSSTISRAITRRLNSSPTARRLTQHSLPSGPLRPFSGRSFTGWTAPTLLAPSESDPGGTFPADDVECHARPWRDRNLGMLLHITLYGLGLGFSWVTPHNHVNPGTGSNQGSDTLTQPCDSFSSGHLSPPPLRT